MTFYHLTLKGDTSSSRRQLCKIILKSMHKCTSYGPEKLNLWPFWPLFDPCDLDLQPTLKNVSDGIFPPPGQQLCNIILKSIHMAPTSSIHDHFDLYLTPMTLTFNVPKKMFQMLFPLLQGNNCATLFWNPCINVQVMLPTSSIHVYDHFDLYLTPVTLTFNLSEKMFQMALLLLKGNNCAKLF